MCKDGSSMTIMLDHRSTAGFIGRRLEPLPQPDSQLPFPWNKFFASALPFEPPKGVPKVKKSSVSCSLPQLILRLDNKKKKTFPGTFRLRETIPQAVRLGGGGFSVPRSTVVNYGEKQKVQLQNFVLLVNYDRSLNINTSAEPNYRCVTAPSRF